MVLSIDKGRNQTKNLATLRVLHSHNETGGFPPCQEFQKCIENLGPK